MFTRLMKQIETNQSHQNQNNLTVIIPMSVRSYLEQQHFRPIVKNHTYLATTIFWKHNLLRTNLSPIFNRITFLKSQEQMHLLNYTVHINPQKQSGPLPFHFITYIFLEIDENLNIDSKTVCDFIYRKAICQK